jgi:hypothetical protein
MMFVVSCSCNVCAVVCIVQMVVLVSCVARLLLGNGVDATAS